VKPHNNDPPAFVRRLGCAKRGFETRARAKAAVRALRGKSRVYRCPHCGLYHTTSQERSW
jgi:hypothetical protein